MLYPRSIPRPYPSSFCFSRSPQPKCNILLLTQVPNSVVNFFTRIFFTSKFPENEYRSRNPSWWPLSLSSTSLVLKHYSIAQLNFTIAKRSFFVLKKKQYNFFPATTKIPDEINKAFPKHLMPSANLETSTVPPPIVIQRPSSSNVSQTVNPNVCIN